MTGRINLLSGSPNWKGFALCANGNLTRDQVKEHMYSGKYALEPKIDGARAVIYRKGGYVAIYTRSGIDVTDRFPRICSLVGNYSGMSSGKDELILDGELIHIDGTFASTQSALASSNPDVANKMNFFAFDILTAPSHQRLWCYPYALRRTVLEEVINNTVGILKVGSIPDSKSAMVYYDDFLKVSMEGCVLKRLDSAYMAGRSYHWLRSKFKTTVSVMPLNVEDNLTVTCSMWTGNGCESVVVGSVQVPEEDLLLILGDRSARIVLEVEAQGVDEKTCRLRHPVFKGIRWDENYNSCVTNQLDQLRRY